MCNIVQQTTDHPNNPCENIEKKHKHADRIHEFIMI